MPVQRHPSLPGQRSIARAEPTRLDPKLFARSQNFTPDPYGVVRRYVLFEPVFSRMAVRAVQDRRSRDFSVPKPIVANFQRRLYLVNFWRVRSA